MSKRIEVPVKNQYVSCIKVDGRPILPPVLDEEKRQAMREWRIQAMEIEKKIKEKKRCQLIRQVEFILDKCVNDVVVSKIEPSKYRLVNIPLLNTKITANNTLPVGEQLARELSHTRSLPSTPVYEGTVEELREQFRQIKTESKNTELSLSESSTTSTDLGPYMEHQGTDSSSGTTTPLIPVDSDGTISLECSTPVSTPVSAQRIRRLSYTLETPSPVLLNMLHKSNLQQQENHSGICIEKLIRNGDSGQSQQQIELTTHSTHVPSSRESTSAKICQISDNGNKADEKEMSQRTESADLSNGNSKYIEGKHWSLTSNEDAKLANSSDNNGNLFASNKTRKTTGIMEQFLLEQQKLMQELLEQQAKEQEKLASLFKEQEKQLMARLKLPESPLRNPVCRNLEQQFTDSSRNLEEKFSKLSAFIRGYLTRRLLATEKVQGIVQTIRDTRQCLRELNQGQMTILPSDIELHRRLIQQLNKAMESFYQIFFQLHIKDRMEIIAQDRQKKDFIVTGIQLNLRPRSRSLSSATLKSIERKLKHESRPNSASTVSSNTTISSNLTDRKRRTCSLSSTSSHSTGPVPKSHGPSHVSVKNRQPWRC